MKLILQIDKGKHAGEQFVLPAQVYRAVGRLMDNSLTVQMTAQGDRKLDPDDLALIEAHINSRDNTEQRPTKARKQSEQSFSRGRDILLEDLEISRAHAMFYFDEQGASVVDLLSTNGTFVNAEQVTEADLHEGDIVHIGKSRFVVKISTP